MSDEKSVTRAPIQSLLLETDDAERVRTIRRQQAERLVAALDTAERGLLRQIVAGWSKAESAAHLEINGHQLEKLRAQLFAKLNAESTTDAVRIGIYAGLD